MHSPGRSTRALIFAIVALAFMLLVCLPFCHAQATNAIAISGQVMQPTGQPAQSASVAICQITAIGTPCSTSGVTLFADPNLISPTGNPVTTDQYGNYSVFTTTGAYQIQVTPAGATGPTYIYYLISRTTPLSGTTGGIGGSALTAGACATGTVAIAGLPLTGARLTATPTTYPGAGFYWNVYPSALGVATVNVCATVAGTPTISTYFVSQ